MRNRAFLHQDTVILISSREIATSVLTAARVDMQWFESVDDFERWRAAGADTPPCLEGVVARLITETRDPGEPLPAFLALAFTWLGRQESVPTLKSFSTAACSRRSFFRSWSMGMPIAPSEFLALLRLAYARRLAANGISLSEIARRTGLSTPRLSNIFES